MVPGSSDQEHVVGVVVEVRIARAASPTGAPLTVRLPNVPLTPPVGVEDGVGLRRVKLPGSAIACTVPA